MMSLNKSCSVILLSCFLVACGGGSPDSSEEATNKPVETVQKSEPKVESAAEAPKEQEVAAVVDPVLARGKRMFLRCKSCHTVDAGGKNGTGPNIHGFFGTAAATKEGFKYSKAMETSGIVWTDEALDAWIEKPRALVPGTSMAFVGIKNAEDREALAAYLKKVTN